MDVAALAVSCLFVIAAQNAVLLYSWTWLIYSALNEAPFLAVSHAAWKMQDYGANTDSDIGE